MPLDYKSSGVNLEAADEALGRVKALVAKARTLEVVGDVGLFAGAFRLQTEAKTNPILLASMDGVGTKLKVAFLVQKFDTVGEDLVNHCANDLLANGADPLFFLDYYGCGKLDSHVMEQVVSGLIRGCKTNGIPLLGGETAEMPGFYKKNDFDLVGTIVGWADEKELILGKDITPGDVILGLPSVGLHTNGYSLARRVLLQKSKLSLDGFIPELGCTLAEELLKVHPSYLDTVKTIREKIKIKGIAHITGGGIEGNLSRIIPKGCRMEIGYGSWEVPPIFDLIQRLGPVEPEEMRRVFNMGVGMAIVTTRKDAQKISNITFVGCKLFELGGVLR